MFRAIVMRRRRAGERGFTLIELVVVLAIMGILLALAMPRYLGARKRAYKAEADNILQEAKTLSWAYHQEYGTFPPDPAAISLVMPSGSHWQAPSVIATGSTSITWQMNGSVSPLTSSDLCSVVLNENGSSSQGCNF